MKGLLTVGLLAGLLAFAAPKRADAGVHVSVGVGIPPFGAVITNGPAYVPYPSYYAPPVPVYVGPPAYYGGYRGYGHYGPRYRHGGGYYGKRYNRGRHCHR